MIEQSWYPGEEGVAEDFVVIKEFVDCFSTGRMVYGCFDKRGTPHTVRRVYSLQYTSKSFELASMLSSGEASSTRAQHHTCIRYTILAN